MFPINRKLPRLSTVWFVASLSLTLWLAFGRPSAQPQPAHASVNSTAIKAPSLSTAKPVSRVKPISEAQLGERTIGKNPLREQIDEELLEPDPQTWRKLTLRLPKENGKFLTVELLRPLDWIEDEEAAVGETIFLDLKEMGAIGDADVVSIEPCPPIQPGKGNVITGRFIHEVAQGEVIELRFANQLEPTRVTKNHPYWSVDRNDFVTAGELREGETVDGLAGKTIVASITPSNYSGPVYNLEINGEHVYRVGSLGLLAHNTCAGKHHFTPRSWGNLIPYGHSVLKPLTKAEHTAIHAAFSDFLQREVGRRFMSQSGKEWIRSQGKHRLNQLAHQFHREFSTTAMGQVIEARLGHSVYDLFKAEYRYAIRNGFLGLAP